MSKEKSSSALAQDFVRAGTKMYRQARSVMPSEFKQAFDVMGYNVAARFGLNNKSNGEVVLMEKDPEVLFAERVAILETRRHLLPETVVIIPDGNRREGKSLGISVDEAHDLGAKMLYESLKAFESFPEVKNIILWAWSEDNEVGRPQEKGSVFGTIAKHVKALSGELHKKGAKITSVGRTDRLNVDIHNNYVPEGDFLAQQLKKAHDLTKDNEGVNIIIAIDYGERYEKRRFAQLLKAEGVDPDIATDEEVYDVQKRSREIPRLSLVVRTSGEKRLSRFPFSNEAELVFVETNTPSLRPHELAGALIEFTDREIREGK